MSKVDEKARLVAAELVASQGVDATAAFDPIVIIALIGLIVQIVMWIQSCRKKQKRFDLARTIKKPSPAVQVRLRTKMRLLATAHGCKVPSHKLVRAAEIVGKREAASPSLERDFADLAAEVG